MPTKKHIFHVKLHYVTFIGTKTQASFIILKNLLKTLYIMLSQKTHRKWYRFWCQIQPCKNLIKINH